MKRNRGERGEGETPGCSSSIVQPSASEGHLSLAGAVYTGAVTPPGLSPLKGGFSQQVA